MNIYGAKTHVDKLLEFVKSLQVSDKQLYQKSKDRLNYIADVCTNIVGTICEIVESDCLATDDNIDEEEQPNDQISEVSTILNTLSTQIDQLREFVGCPAVDTTSVEKQPDKEVKPQLQSQSKPIKSARIKTLKQYSNTLQSIQFADSSPSLTEFSTLLFEWYNTRIRGNPSQDFHYNVNQFPDWIISWVITYGKHINQKTSKAFKEDAENWIKKIDKNNNYAVPYEVYRIYSGEIDDDYVTCQSLILWESLYDQGLYKLEDVPIKESRISKDMMKNFYIKTIGQERYQIIENMFYKKVGK